MAPGVFIHGGIMDLPKKIFISRRDIMRYKIIFPGELYEDGKEKEVILKPGVAYKTEDKKELEFVANNCKGLGIATMSDLREIKDFIANVQLPELDDPNLTKEKAAKFVWKDEHEDEIVKALKDHGYIVEKIIDVEPEPTEPEPVPEVVEEVVEEAINPFVCDICGKVCKTAAGLKAHMRSHKES